MLGMVVYIYNPSTQEMKSEQSEAQGHPQLQSEFKVSQRYTSLSLPTQEREMIFFHFTDEET